MKRLLFFMLLATQVAAAQFPVTEVNRTFQRIDDSLADMIDGLMLDSLSSFQMPGGSVGILIDGEVAYLAGYGYRDDSFNCAATVDGFTQFVTASMCKPVTGLLVKKVAADYPGFSTEDLLEDWLGAELPACQGSGVKVKHLLNHQARMGQPASWPEGNNDFGKIEFSDLLALDVAQVGEVNGQQTQFDPLHDAVAGLAGIDTLGFYLDESDAAYANGHYMTLGALVQKVTGERYGELMKRYITDPLNMHRFELDYPWRTSYNRARAFGPTITHDLSQDVFSQRYNVDFTDFPWITMAPSTSWLASAFDYVMLMKAVDMGYFSVADMEDVYGFRNWSGGVPTRFSHAGLLPGVKCAMRYQFDSRLGVVVFGNSSHQGNDVGLRDKLISQILSQSPVLSGPVFDESERVEDIVSLSGGPYVGESYANPVYLASSMGGSDVVTLAEFEGHWTSTASIPVNYGDVRVVAEDRIVMGDGTRILEGGRFVAYLDNVGEFKAGDGNSCYTDLQSRSAEDEAVEAGATGLTLWPNPSDGRFRVEGLLEEDRLIVLDMVGRVVLDRAVLHEGGMELDVSAQPPGIYFARVVSKDGAADTRRFVIR